MGSKIETILFGSKCCLTRYENDAKSKYIQ